MIKIGALLIAMGTGYGGAITSLKWHNYDFIDRADHGRLLQSAISFDGKGEADNPTEGGCVITLSEKKQKCSSVIYKSGLTSIAKLGLWDSGKDSGVRLLKNISADGYNGISIATSFLIPIEHKTATVEALTIYTPSVWVVKAIRYDPVADKEYPVGNNGEKGLPVIISTTFGAIGMYSSELPYYVGPDLVGYGLFDLSDEGTMKLNCVFRHTNIPANSILSHQCTIFVGGLSDVKEQIRKRYLSK